MAASPAISRTLSRALLWSLGLHLLLLWPRPLPEAARSRGLHAHLSKAVSVSAKAEPAPQSAAQVQQTSPRAINPPATAQGVPHLPFPQAMLQNASPSVVLPAASNGLDAGGLRAYRVALALAVRRSGLFIHGLAPDMRGRVELGIALSAQGQLVGVDVRQSSGNPNLDHLAVLALTESVQRTVLPSVLQGQALSLVLPLEVD